MTDYSAVVIAIKRPRLRSNLCLENNVEVLHYARVRDCSGNPLRLPSGRDCNGKRGITPKSFGTAAK